MSETMNSRLGLYGAERSKCNHRMTLGFKGLTTLSYRNPVASFRTARGQLTRNEMQVFKMRSKTELRSGQLSIPNDIKN